MVLDRLRVETAEQHHRLERRLNLLHPEFDLSGYRQLLTRWYGFHSDWEPQALAHADTSTRDLLAARRKLPLLESDLEYLGIETANVERCGPLRFLGGQPSVLGSMYVIEGSTLGGKVLSRHFERRFGVTSVAGGAYFSSYQAQIGAMWQSFRAHLTKCCSSDVDEEMVAAARDTFLFLEEWLCPTKP